jgi:putative peptidoglycan lipid II flippase
MKYALISVVLNIVLGVTLVWSVGFYGIAAATTAAAWLNLGQMAFALARRKDYRPSAAAWSRLARIFLASLVLGGLLALAAHFRPQIEAPFAGFHIGRKLVGAKEVAICLTVMVGGLLYPVLLLAFGGLTPADLRSALRRPAKASLTAEIEEDLGKTPAGPDLL